MHAWTWFLQRVSAVVIIIALGLHIAYLHFGTAGEPLTYSHIMSRFKMPLLITFDLLLLIFGLYHSLYGVYSVFLDFDSGKKEKFMVLGLLIITGLGLSVFGVFSLLRTVYSI